jgi:hypothetical protein
VSSNLEAVFKKKSAGTLQYSDFIATQQTGELTADDIINQHLKEEEMQNKATKDKARQHKKKTGSASKEKGQEDEDTIEDELYDDDPEFEEIANNNEVKGSKLSDEGGSDGVGNEENFDYMDDSLNLSQKSPKQTLIDHLRLLADIFNSSAGEGASDYYDQLFDERA